MRAHIIQVSGQVITYPNWPEKIEETAHMLKDIVGGNIEYVSVLFEDNPATMIVNETGAMVDKEHPFGQLAPNARATAIYWSATIQGVTAAKFDPLAMPMIHGHAVLIEKDKREL